MNGKPVTAILAAILPLVLLVMAAQTKGEPFRLIWSEEATIADIHAALKSKELQMGSGHHAIIQRTNVRARGRATLRCAKLLWRLETGGEDD